MFQRLFPVPNAYVIFPYLHVTNSNSLEIHCLFLNAVKQRQVATNGAVVET